MATSRQALRKVPEITVWFWVVKLLTTAMGEATSDYMVLYHNPYIAVTIGGLGLLLALALQFVVRRYNAWVYWLTVSMVAIFGTMAADGVHVRLGVPYAYSTIFFSIVLAIIFIVWQRTERTLSIHSITTPRREVFYWLTVLSTFALGTAAGDLAATTMKLGYFTAGLVFTGLIMLPAIARLIGANEVLTFWIAYILTRPLGASFADWTSKPPAISGLGWGDGHVAIYLTILIVVCVAYLAKSRVDIKSDLRSG
jgi:uncharacterized membrane-anchored protein